MLDLRDLIICRINQLRQIPKALDKLLEYFAPTTTIQGEFQLNRAIMKQLTLLKKAEKQRIEKEALLLQQIKSMRFLNTKVIEEVYYTSLDIFTCFDHNTHILCHIDSSLSDKLRKLYLRFFEKHQPPFNLKDLFQLLSRHITESTPFILMAWVCEWARGHFAEEIQNFIGREFSRHEEEMKRINYSRGNSTSAIKEKYTNLFSNSTSLPRAQDNMLMLTNKESFYGLITEELTRYYKSLPLDLDLGFIKSLRKLHSKGNEFQKDQNLQKAAEILIDSKNRHIKEQMEKYAAECEQYRQKYPNVLAKNVSQSNIKKKQQYPSISPHKQSKCQLKKPFSFQKFFDRVKSQSKQDSTANTYSQKRNSLLLCSKNQISFQSSKEIMKKLHRDKVRKQFELPELVPNNRMVSSNNPTFTSQNKQASFFGPVNRSMISNYQKANKNVILQQKCYDFKPSSKDRLKEKINTSCLRISQKSRLEIEENPQTTRRDLQDLKINRKLMLQLLREKNKHAFLDK